jgi:hypothetical protein
MRGRISTRATRAPRPQSTSAGSRSPVRCHPRALSLVAEWVALHRVELSANWELARREQPLKQIEPLP